MKAAVLTAFRAPLEIQTVPDPTLGDGDAVVRVDACGICRSDWHLWQEIGRGRASFCRFRA